LVKHKRTESVELVSTEQSIFKTQPQLVAFYKMKKRQLHDPPPNYRADNSAQRMPGKLNDSPLAANLGESSKAKHIATPLMATMKARDITEFLKTPV